MRAIILTAGLLSASAAYGQAPPCAPEANLLPILERNMGLVPTLHLDGGPGVEFIILTSPDNQWAILRTNGEIACVMAGGNGVAAGGEPV